MPESRFPRHRSGRTVRRWAAAVASVALAASIVFTPGVAAAAPGPAEAPEWWFDAWSVNSLWSSGADGRGITVAVVDTGVQASIPELSGKVLPGADLIGNGTDGRTDFDGEDFSHGTAMASIIAARKGYGDIQGIAPNAKILPIAIPLRGVVRRGIATPNATSTAVKYAVDHGAKVVSMSLGGLRYEGEDDLPCPTDLQAAIVYALNKGALVVAASGNSGEDGSPVEEPGVCLGVISVGAVDKSQNVSSFSSRHPYLTVSAPGDDIPTLSRVANRAFIGGGTSQATAMASAAVAMIWSKHPTETNSQITSRLIAGVTDRGTKGRDAQYGYGVINPKASLRSAAPPTTTSTVFADAAPLLTLAKSTAPKLTPKAAAGQADAPIGSVAVGKAPGATPARFVAFLIVAVVLLLAAIALVILAIRRGRRRQRPVPTPAWSYG